MSIWTRQNQTINNDGFLSVLDPNNILPVEGGGVQIKADKWTETIWHGGQLATANNWTFQYGYAELRAKLAKGQGLISAFWLFNANHNEIDVFEAIDPACKNLQLTTHRGAGDSANTEYIGNVDLSADWHLYGVKWTPDYVSWYLDGVKIWYQVDRVPQVPLSIYVMLSVGGWPGLPDGATPNPSYFNMDYVKVWQ